MCANRRFEFSSFFFLLFFLIIFNYFFTSWYYCCSCLALLCDIAALSKHCDRNKTWTEWYGRKRLMMLNIFMKASDKKNVENVKKIAHDIRTNRTTHIHILRSPSTTAAPAFHFRIKLEFCVSFVSHIFSRPVMQDIRDFAFRDVKIDNKGGANQNYSVFTFFFSFSFSALASFRSFFFFFLTIHVLLLA